MKTLSCKLCGATTYNNSALGAVALSLHKQQAHPEVVQATREKAQATREAKAQAEAEVYRRKQAAGLAVSRKVIKGYGDAPYPHGDPVVDLSSLDGYDAQRARYPEPRTFRAYQELLERIKGLQMDAQANLAQSYTEGQPVLIEDWQKIQDVMREA